MSLSVEQQRQINVYLKQNPKVSREQAIIQLFGGGEAPRTSTKGLVVESNGAKKVTSTAPAVLVKSGDKTYNLNKTIELRINNVSKNLKKTEDSNGFMGSAWSGFKNLTGIGDSSDKVREKQEVEQKLLVQFNANPQKRAEIFKKLTGQDYNPENLLKFIKGEIKLPSELALNGYKEGQEMAVDVGADIVSGVAAVGIYTAAVAAAPFTGGASIVVGVAAATATGAAVKTGLKAGDALSGGREYSLKDAGHDAATGAFSGALAPVTGGMGGAVGKTVATKLGVQAVKTVGKKVAEEAVESGVKQTVKTILTNPTGYEYVGGTAIKRATALGAEMAVDGAAGGAADNAFRTAIDGGSVTEIMEAAGEGAVGGLILSPAIGGGLKGMSHFAGKILNKQANGVDVSVSSKVDVAEDFEFDGVLSNTKSSPSSQLAQPKKHWYTYNVKLTDGSMLPITTTTQVNQKEIVELAKTQLAMISKITIKNEKLNTLLKEVKLSPNQKLVLSDLEPALNEVKVPKVNAYIEKRINEMIANKKCTNEDLHELTMVVDAINELSGSYTQVYRNLGVDKSLIKKSNLGQFADYMKGQGKSVDTLMSPDAAGHTVNRVLNADLNKEAKLYGIKEYVSQFPNTEMSDYFYNLYLHNYKDYPDIIQPLAGLAKKYNTKVFLPTLINKEAFNKVTKYLDDELAQWKTASNGNAKFPPSIDFSTAKSDWYDKGAAYGQGAANAYSDPSRNGALAFSGGLNLTAVHNSLRHEITHTNDLKHGANISDKYNLDEIMPKKVVEINGRKVQVPDIENCKYLDEFRNAGLPEDRLAYAYNNTKEFIARASECDMSKFSPEFKQILIDFGMPEWMFKMAPRAKL